METLVKTPMEKKGLSWVGKSVERSDARAKVSGEALYIDDYAYEGMLHAVTIRSPAPRIRIKGIKAKRAEKVDGFWVVITSQDIPGKNLWPLVIHDYPFLAEKEARFAGEALALVVAETPEAARQAASLVKIDYEELPFVTDPLEAMKKNASKVYGDDNVFSKYVIKKGDVERGFEEADAVVEGTYTTGYHIHSYLETQGAIGFPDGDGGVEVYGSIQCPYYVHDAVVQILGLSYNKVRIVQRAIGGAFGGKEDMAALVGAHAALAAWVTRRPVKLVYDRREDFISMSRRHPSWVHVRYGAKRDGTLVACQIKYVLDGGAYATLTPIVLWRGTIHAAGPYRIPNVFVESYGVATNKAPCGAFRGFGQPQVCFANESLIDDLALKLGMDPLDFRLRNALRVGDKTATGQVMGESCGPSEALEKVRESSNWDKKRAAPLSARSVGDRFLQNGGKREGVIRKGIGVSAGFYGVGLGARGKFLDRAAAQVQIQPDGTVIVSVGNTEMGQGAKTVLAQICADRLNTPYDKIKVRDVDTSRVPDSGPTVASRTTLMSGNAILSACEPLRERIWRVAGSILGEGSEMVASEGFFCVDGGSVSFRNVVRQCYQQRLKMAEQGWYSAPPTSYDMETGQGDAYVTYSCSANVAEVEVDTETGEVRVLRMTAAHDLGKVVNPAAAEAQVEGGVLQAIGYALIERVVVKDGIILNPNFTDYVLPSPGEVPEFKTILLEKPYPEGPYGVKGFGECPMIGPAPAIINAVYHACGVRIRRLPAVPEVVWEELRKNDNP